MNNLFVAYDLISPGQNYDAVQDRIRSLGRWYKLQYSLFYLHTALSAEQVYDRVLPTLDVNDKLLVIDAKKAIATPLAVGDVEAINALWLGTPPLSAAANW